MFVLGFKVRLRLGFRVRLWPGYTIKPLSKPSINSLNRVNVLIYPNEHMITLTGTIVVVQFTVFLIF